MKAALIVGALSLIACSTLAQTAAQSFAEAEANVRRATSPEKAKVAHRALQAVLATQAGSVDFTAPALQNFSITGSINVQKVGVWAQMTATVKDDLSGVRSVSVGLRSPSGKSFRSIYVSLPMPEKKATWATTVGADSEGMMASFGPWSEAGEWLVDYVNVMDAAGNGVWVPHSALAANGWSDRVTVLNSKVDQLPPTLTKGVLGLSEASLAANAPGTTQPGYVYATLTLSDTGESGISGIASASLKLCRVNADQWCMSSGQSISLWGTQYVRGKGTVSLKVAGQLRRANSMDTGNELGDYRIIEASVRDSAGNSTSLRSIDLGGTTDFKTLFPNTIFTLNP